MIEITCPQCQHQQRESERAISTNCRKCGCYIKFKRPPFWQRFRHGATLTLEVPVQADGPRFRRSADAEPGEPAPQDSSSADGQDDPETPVSENAANSPNDPAAIHRPGLKGRAPSVHPDNVVPKHFAMPKSKIRTRLGIPDATPEPLPEESVENEPPAVGDSNASPGNGVTKARPSKTAISADRPRSAWIGPVERERRLGRETTPKYFKSPSQGLSEQLPELFDPSQRSERKVRKPRSADAQYTFSSLLHDEDEPGSGQTSPADLAPQIEPADLGRAFEQSPAPASSTGSQSGSRSCNQTTMAKGRERGHFRQGYFREAVCFQCGEGHQTNRSAKTSTCPKCGTSIQLADMEINSLHDQPIRTLGNVSILRNGRLTGGPVVCQDFVLQGQIDCEVHCSDEFHVRSDSELPVKICCRRFVVAPKVRVRALEPVQAVDAEILGTFEGDLACTGSVAVGPQGHVIGDVTAGSIRLETGGVLEGGMTILADSADAGVGSPS